MRKVIKPSETTELYFLRRPFSHASINVSNGFSDIALEVDGAYAGTLRIPSGTQQRVVLGILADTNLEVGVLDVDGSVVWSRDPNVYHQTVVVDGYGHVHEVNQLGEG